MFLPEGQGEKRDEGTQGGEKHDHEGIHAHDDADERGNRRAGSPDAHELVQGQLDSAALDMLAGDLAQLAEDAERFLLGALAVLMVDVAALGEDAKLSGDEKRHDA